jgi:hypothetical protein
VHHLNPEKDGKVPTWIYPTIHSAESRTSLIQWRAEHPAAGDRSGAVLVGDLQGGDGIER